MKRYNKILTLSILVVLLILMFPLVCFGNSAEPPSILIIVHGAPDNLEIKARSDNFYSQAKTIDKGIEKYYIFHSRDLRTAASNTLIITLGKSTYEIPIVEPLKSYNNVFTLDLTNRTLSPGKLLTRSIFLVITRIALTLIIEAFVFYLMGFRQKRSWVAFLVINCLTQGFLNIWLNSFSPVESYIILSLIFGEILVFISEIFMFLGFVHEHRRWRVLSYVLLANTISLIAGGYIILNLPL